MSDSWIMGQLAAQDRYDPKEGAFQTGIRATPWFSEFKQKYGEEPNLNDPNYDYRAAWRAGARPDVRDPGDRLLHWPSQFKGENHPNRYVDGVDTRGGDDVGVYRGMPRLDPGIRRAPGDTAMRPAAETFGQVVGDLVIPQDPLDYAAMFALGPAGKLASKGARAGALAMGGVLGLSDEAEAGKLDLIKKGIKAYHSSPHDFEKFDASKIGTGEGAQVYGHGLYFAENPKVSGQGGEYWNQFLRHPSLSEAERAAAERLRAEGFDRDAALRSVQRDVEDWRRSPKLDVASDYAKQRLAFREAEQAVLASGQPVGPRTYEVNIRADPAQMLDWDKPLAQQGDVAEAFRSAVPDPGWWSRQMGDMKTIRYEGATNPERTGAQTYGALARMMDQPRASAALAEAGIPGIKYLDQGSRVNPPRPIWHPTSEKWQVDTGPNSPRFDTKAEAEAFYNDLLAKTPQTSSYVIFDPSIVDIMKKYGIAGAAAPMGALAAQDEYR